MDKPAKMECDIARIILYVNNACGKESRDEVKIHASLCPQCKKTMEELIKEKEVYLSKHPFSELGDIQQFIETIETQPSKPSYNPYSGSVDDKASLENQYAWSTVLSKSAIYKKPKNIIPPVVVYIGVILMVLLGVGSPFVYSYVKKHFQLIPKDVVIQREPLLLLYVKQNDGAQVRRSEQIYHPNELLQFAYSCDDKQYLTLVRMNEKGEVFPVCPENWDSVFVIQNSGINSIPQTIVVDTTLGREFYVGIFSNEKLSEAEVTNSLLKTYILNQSLDKIVLENNRSSYSIKTILTEKRLAVQG